MLNMIGAKMACNANKINVKVINKLPYIHQNNIDPKTIQNNVTTQYRLFLIIAQERHLTKVC